MLKGYMKDRFLTWAVFLFFYMALFLIGYLYEIPLEKIGYIAEFTAAGAFVCLLVDGSKYAARWKELKQRLRATDPCSGAFYTVPGAMESLYRDLLEKAGREKEEVLYEHEMKYDDMMDYYGMWAHQIKTPMAAMRILLQSAGEGPETKIDRKLYDSLQMELFKTEQYVEMVLSYLRIGDISKDMVLTGCDIAKMVRQAVKKYSRLFILQKISLEMGEIRETVVTDEKWLSFVIEQILSNALKYTKKGKVSIYMEPGERLVIEDTGIGISAEDLPRIMEKGYTGYNGRKDKKSTGIGLYLCRKVMDKLNHGIDIESEPGKGTRVILNLGRRKLNTE